MVKMTIFQIKKLNILGNIYKLSDAAVRIWNRFKLDVQAINLTN